MRSHSFVYDVLMDMTSRSCRLRLDKGRKQNKKDILQLDNSPSKYLRLIYARYKALEMFRLNVDRARLAFIIAQIPAVGRMIGEPAHT